MRNTLKKNWRIQSLVDSFTMCKILHWIYSPSFPTGTLIFFHSCSHLLFLSCVVDVKYIAYDKKKTALSPQRDEKRLLHFCKVHFVVVDESSRLTVKWTFIMGGSSRQNDSPVSWTLQKKIASIVNTMLPLIIYFYIIWVF